jgi:hypothetical protein
MVARPVTCAPRHPRSTSTRQLTGLYATTHRPDARAQAPGRRFLSLVRKKNGDAARYGSSRRVRARLELGVDAAVLVEDQVTLAFSTRARSSPRGGSFNGVRCRLELGVDEAVITEAQATGWSRWGSKLATRRLFQRRSRQPGARRRGCRAPRGATLAFSIGDQIRHGPSSETQGIKSIQGTSARASALADLWSGRPGQSCWLRRAVHRCDSGVTRCAEPRRWCGPDRGPASRLAMVDLH